ncbi:hypothetical protein D3C76_968130 [compost metagenome]
MRLAYARGHMAHGFIGKWNGQQVVQVPVIAAITQVFAVQLHLVAVKKLAGLVEQVAIQRRTATQRQRQSVAGDGKTLGQLGEAFAISTANGNPVFRRTFEKVHCIGAHRQQFGQQAATQAKPGIQRRKVHIQVSNRHNAPPEQQAGRCVTTR